MKIESKIFALVLASVLIGTVAVNQVYAPRDCGSCTQFKKLTHEFEKNVIKSIGDPNIGPEPHLRGLLDAYSQDVQRIFVGDPNIDQVRILLQSYEQDVIALFDTPPPEPDKQLSQDFWSLTHDFEKAIPGIIIAASTDNNR